MSKVVSEACSRKGVQENGSVFPKEEKIFNQMAGIFPEGTDAFLTEQCHKAVSEFNDEVMIVIISLKGFLLSKHKKLKVELQN